MYILKSIAFCLKGEETYIKIVTSVKNGCYDIGLFHGKVIKEVFFIV